MIEFNFVYSKDSLSIRKFLKTNDVDKYISYQDTFNRLTKNDFYAEEPCDIVVNSFLIKELEKHLNSENPALYYVISNLDEDVICNIKHFVEDYKDAPIYQLFVINDDCAVPISCFDRVHFIDNA